MGIKIKLFALLCLFSCSVFATSCEYSDPKTKFIYDKTMSTIGDSMVLLNHFRCSLRDKGLDYDFVGNLKDNFGFMHDGIGAQNTIDILGRISGIPHANAYLVLAGTNDVLFPPEITVRNLSWIGGVLANKHKNSVVYISTLLPRRDIYNARNHAVNKILLSKRTTLCSNCFVVDAGERFSSIPGWEYLLNEGGVHLTAEGYDAYAALVMESLAKFYGGRFNDLGVAL